MSRRRQAGFSSTEYAIVGAAIVAALLVPMPDVTPFDGRPLIVTLIDVIRSVFGNFAYAAGLPRFR
jgi:hypothetical protein